MLRDIGGFRRPWRNRPDARQYQEKRAAFVRGVGFGAVREQPREPIAFGGVEGAAHLHEVPELGVDAHVGKRVRQRCVKLSQPERRERRAAPEPDELRCQESTWLEADLLKVYFT